MISWVPNYNIYLFPSCFSTAILLKYWTLFHPHCLVYLVNSWIKWRSVMWCRPASDKFGVIRSWLPPIRLHSHTYINLSVLLLTSGRRGWLSIVILGLTAKWSILCTIHTSMKLVSLSTGTLGEGELSGAPVLLAKAWSSSRDIPLSLIRRRRLLVLWRGTLKWGYIELNVTGTTCALHSKKNASWYRALASTFM